MINLRRTQWARDAGIGGHCSRYAGLGGQYGRDAGIVGHCSRYAGIGGQSARDAGIGGQCARDEDVADSVRGIRT